MLRLSGWVTAFDIALGAMDVRPTTKFRDAARSMTQQANKEVS